MDTNGNTLLHLTFQRRERYSYQYHHEILEIMNLLLQQPKIMIHQRDNDGQTALDVAKL
jgi:hypothetical protein